MKFANVSTNALRFDIAGEWYECLPGECVEIPDNVAFAVASRGIALVPATEVEPAEAPRAPEPVAPPVKAESETEPPPAVRPGKRGR